MIVRIWHGWTTPELAPAYANLLQTEIFHAIAERGIVGFLGIELLAQERPAEVEFITIMRFDSLESVKVFAGEDYEQAVVPPEARELLSRFDERSQHYESLVRHGIEN